MKQISHKDQFNLRFLNIQKSFRNFDPMSILLGCLEWMYEPTPNKLDQIKKHP